MNQRQFYIHLACLIFTGLSMTLFNSCNDNGTYTMGSDLIDTKSSLAIADTFTLNTYTIKPDSIQTSGYQSLLAGSYTDGALGTVKATGYFRVLPETYNLTIADNGRFDSIVLDMNYSGAPYGDTTLYTSLEVHQLLTSLYRSNQDDQTRYNTSTLPYSPENLGSKTFIPKPSTKKYLEIKLSDQFGQDLYDKLKAGDDIYDNSTNFYNYFQGIALTPGTGPNNAVVRFNASDTAIFVRMYYHEGVEAKIFTFNFTDATLQFNHIEPDEQGSPLAVLKKQTDKLPSSESENISYCQGATGLATKIEIPYLKNLNHIATYIKLIKAELILKPVKNSYNLIGLPDQLSLYQTNNENYFLSGLTDSNGNSLTPTVTIDKILNENTSYTFDITNYISYYLQQNSTDPPALLVTINSSHFNSTLERVFLGNNNHPTNASKLKLYFWKMND